MRLTSEAPFPYGYPGRTCYLEKSAYCFRQIIGRPDMRATVTRALHGDCEVYAVWPGEYRSDLFKVDDLAALAVAVGVKESAA